MNRIVIPPFGIRERRPPNVRVSVGVEGWLRWELINRKGRVTRGGEQSNLILDQGLDQIAAYGLVNAGGQVGVANATAGIAYAAVGTDSTTPDESDTGLGAEVDRTNIGPSGLAVDETINRSADGVYDHVRVYEFDFAQAIGNLTEWGISPIATPGGNLYARELFRDGGGSPEPVTKTSDDKLRLAYTRRTTITPTNWTPGSLDIMGHATVSGDYRLIGAEVGGAGETGYMDLRVFTRIATGAEPGAAGGLFDGGALLMYNSDQSGMAYAHNTTFSGDGTSAAVGLALHGAAPTYTPGSFSRDGRVLKYTTNRGNFEHYAIGISGTGRTSQRFPFVGFIFDYDPSEEWTKDDLHELRVTLPTVTWARV